MSEIKRRRFSFKKSQWKRRVRKATEAAGIEFNLQRLGGLPSIADVYDDARVLMSLGLAGERLHAEAATLDMVPKVCYDLEHHCKLLEVCNRKFFQFAERMNWPTGQFAVYVSGIVPTSIGEYDGEEDQVEVTS